MDVYSQGMRNRSMRSVAELAGEMKVTEEGNLSNWSSGVQIPRDICTRLKRYLYSAKRSWIIKRVSLLVNDNEVDLLADLHTNTDPGVGCVPVGR